jgi:membrane protease YdiL (CAAX protease family)
MPSLPAQSPRPAPEGRWGRFRNYFGKRVDPLTSLFLVLPLFVVYQLGVLTQMRCWSRGCVWSGNGVDFLTGNVMALTHGSRLTYGLSMLAVAVALAIGILWARRRSQLHPRLFLPVLAESAIYASLVGPIAVSLQQAVGLGARAGRGYVGDVISSFGAGLHEELIFRAILFAGGAFLLERTGMRRWMALLASALVSSALFSAVHHLGPLGEPFTLGAFAFRFGAGLVFATIYRARGFAIAAWTHALYDVWIFTLQRVG